MFRFSSNNPRKPFSQAEIHSRLRIGLPRKLHVRMLNNPLIFRAVNAEYELAWKLERKGPLSAAHLQVAADLRRDGFARSTFADLFPHLSFARLQEEFLQAVAAFRERVSTNPRYGAKKYIENLVDTFTLGDGSQLTEIVSDEPLALTVASYMGMVPRFSGVRVWRTLTSEIKNPVASQQWHRDYNDSLFTKVFILMNDVGPENGPTQYLRETHRAGRFASSMATLVDDKGLRRYLSDEEVESGPIPAQNIVSCTGHAGSVFFIDTFGLHRGGRCSIGNRDLVMVHYNTNANIDRGSYRFSPESERPRSSFMQRVLGWPIVDVGVPIHPPA